MQIIKKPSSIVLIKTLILFLISLTITGVSFFFKEQIEYMRFFEKIGSILEQNNLISYDTYDKMTSNEFQSFFSLMLAVSLFFLIIYIYKYFVLKKTEYIFDFDRQLLIIKEGLFKKDQDTIGFNNFIDVDLSKSFIENLLNKSTILIYTKGDMSSTNKGLSMAEKNRIEEINASLEMKFINLKKISSIKEGEDLMYKIRENMNTGEKAYLEE